MGVRTRSFDTKAPQRYKPLIRQFTVANAAADNNRQAFVWPFVRKGIVVDFVVTLEVAGTITNLTVTPKKNNSQAVCSTNGVIAVAAGVGATIDAKAETSLPAGGTRPVLHSTVANRTLSKGDRVTLDFAQSGTVTTGAQCTVVCVFEGEE